MMSRINRPQPQKGASWRLFVAISVPAIIRKKIMGYQACFPEVNFASNLHITLRFIGEQPDYVTCADALASVHMAAPFIQLCHFGLMRRRIFHAVVRESEALMELQASIDNALLATGLMPDKRSFRPHITLARLRREASRSMLERAEGMQLDVEWKAREFCLFRSHLGGGSALHEILRSYPLEG